MEVTLYLVVPEVGISFVGHGERWHAVQPEGEGEECADGGPSSPGEREPTLARPGAAGDEHPTVCVESFERRDLGDGSFFYPTAAPSGVGAKVSVERDIGPDCANQTTEHASVVHQPTGTPAVHDSFEGAVDLIEVSGPDQLVVVDASRPLGASETTSIDEGNRSVDLDPSHLRTPLLEQLPQSVAVAVHLGNGSPASLRVGLDPRTTNDLGHIGLGLDDPDAT